MHPSAMTINQAKAHASGVDHCLPTLRHGKIGDDAD
jgi:hypothetical protein